MADLSYGLQVLDGLGIVCHLKKSLRPSICDELKS